MFVPIKDRAMRDRLAKDYIETKNRVKDKLVSEQFGMADYQEDAKKIFKPIIDTQNEGSKIFEQAANSLKKELKETVQEIPKALTIAISSELARRSEQALDSAPIEQAISLKPTKAGIEYFMNDVDQNLDLETVAKYNFPPMSQLIGDPNNPNLPRMLEIINSRNQKGSVTHEKNKITRLLNKQPTEDRRLELLQDYANLSAYETQVNHAYRFFNKIKTGEGINYYRNPLQLFQRLCLLVSSKEAGNTGLDNEISEIIDELLETNVISKSDAKTLFEKYLD